MKLKTTALALFFAFTAPLAVAAEVKPYVYSAVAEQPQAAQDREIAGLFDRWNSALQTGNPQSVVSLYAPNAVLQPTVSNQVRSTHAQIQDYFEHFLAGKPVGQINYREIRHLGPDAAMDSGVYTFTLTQADGCHVARLSQNEYLLLGGLRLVEHLAADGVDLHQPGVASRLQPRRIERGLGLSGTGASFIEGRLIAGRIDHVKHLAGLDLGTFGK